MIHPPDPDALAARLLTFELSLPGFSELDFDALSPRGRIDALLACERLARYVYGLNVLALAALHRAAQREANDVRAGNTEAEVMAATRWPVSTVQDRMREAGTLVGRFPETVAFLMAGRVSQAQARALVEITRFLGDDHARAVQAKVLPRMPGQAQSTTRKAIHHAVKVTDPQGDAERHAKAKEYRRVRVHADLDGMATVELYTTAETARAVLNALDAHCRKRAKGDKRTLDQRRADTLAALVLGGAPGEASVPALVYVVVNIETLLGISDAPARLEGYGPISALQARIAATEPGSIWRQLTVTPDGHALHIASKGYRPDAQTARMVRALNPHCQFPGCTMPARRCDLDHRTNYADGGATDTDNVGPLCETHHQQKTAGLWHLEKAGARFNWTSVRTGKVYTHTPEPYDVIGDDDLIE